VGTLWGAYLLLKKSMEHQREILTSQRTELSRLLNLVAAKDLQTFTALQTMTIPSFEMPSNFDPNFVALDDESVAARMASHYEKNGTDPNLAYNSEDLANEFGVGGVIIP
jgi:hypothetical protein